MASPRRDAEQTLKILGTSEVLTLTPKRQFGMVSPCSHCKNHLVTLPEGDVLHTPCPRRLWIRQQQDQSTANANNTNPYPNYLSESGTDDPNQLTNPVYSDDNSSTFVWVALDDNNKDLVDANGNIVRHSIEGPGFSASTDSEYLQCESLPYVPHLTQGKFYADGVLHEQDQLYVDTGYDPQLDPSGNPQFIGGSVQKVTHPFYWSLKTALRDNNPAGC